MPVIPLPIGANLLPDATTARGFRFGVHKLLGAGGFGITYLAKDAQLGDLCVVKEFALEALFQREQAGTRLIVVHGRESEHNHWLEKFFREARLLHHVRHEGAVTVRAVWRENNTAYFAMEFVDGIQLPAQPMAGVGWATWEPVAKKFLIALGAVHDAGLSHGDIKPPNVLVRRDGQPTLIDFGTARAARDLEKTHLTALITSHGYSPPELSVRDRAKEVGPWSDLYSWAMTVMGLVVEHGGDGGAPLGASERLALLKHGISAAGYGAPLEKQLLAAQVPANWTKLLLRCVVMDPTARPQSVAEALAALHEPPIVAAPGPATGRLPVGKVDASIGSRGALEATAPKRRGPRFWFNLILFSILTVLLLACGYVFVFAKFLDNLEIGSKPQLSEAADPTKTAVPWRKVKPGAPQADASPAGSPDAGTDVDARSKGDVNQRSQADAEAKKKAGFPQTEGSPAVGSARRPKRAPTSEPEPEPEPEDPEFAAGEPLHPPAATSKPSDPQQGRTGRKTRDLILGTKPSPAAPAPTTAPK
ncbi:MAG: serine/threonine protein kinase [Deltaproteobacteria bacterium]|nr:serine/threonine protein kinase [Deltaproteobacteria bacterium]